MEHGPGPTRAAILRDLLIFQAKLGLDGLKGFLISQASLWAAVAEMFVLRRERGRWFYRVLAAGERFDLWLNLYGPARRAAARGEDLFSASRAGDDTLLGRIEALAHGPEEPAPAPARPPA